MSRPKKPRIQRFALKASNSTSVRWYSFFVEGTAAFFMLDADAWIYPAVYGLVLSVAAAFYYLRIIKTMWFDPPEGQTDAPPLDARMIAIGSAAFSLPLVMPALALLDPLALAAAKAFGLA